MWVNGLLQYMYGGVLVYLEYTTENGNNEKKNNGRMVTQGVAQKYVPKQFIIC